MAIANGTFSYMPPRILQRFEIDLQVIPAYLAQKKDCVVVREKIEKAWQTYMRELGFELPEFILRESIENSESLNKRIGYLRPWGWSPVTHRFFKDIKPLCCQSYRNIPNYNWEESHKDLYSRITSLEIYKYIVSNYNYDFLSGSKDTPSVCYNISEIEQLLGTYRKIIVKAPWSSSGRGILIIRGNELTTPEKQWISGILKNQKYIMVEELRDKLFDISFHYYIDEKSKVNYIGNASFKTDDKGAYVGNNLQAIPKRLNSELKDFLSNDKIEQLADILKEALMKSPLAKEYYGYLGVDAYVYRTQEGLKIFPCVEINLRYNMGTLNLKLRDIVHPDAEGLIITDRIIKGSVCEFVESMKKNHPIEYKDEKLLKGFIPLTPSNEDSEFIYYLLME